jgi:hypothetical protein
MEREVPINSWEGNISEDSAISSTNLSLDSLSQTKMVD